MTSPDSCLNVIRARPCIDGLVVLTLGALRSPAFLLAAPVACNQLPDAWGRAPEVKNK
jgi:hypothetical protein